MAGGLVAGGFAAWYYSFEVEPNWLDRTETDISLNRLSPALDGLNILLLADTHVAAWGRREDRLLTLLESNPAPDLLLWGGDFIQGRAGVPDALRLVEAVKERLPRVPTYGVLGNAEHKLRWRERREFVDELERRGVQTLLNRSTVVSFRGEAFTLAGVDDPYYGHADLERALAGTAPDVFTLLLAHSPQIATQAARAGVDLMLSGHTHGGQVRLPLIGPLKTQNPLCFHLDCGLFPPDRLRRTLGYDPGGHLTTFITRGIGIARVPRLGWPAPRFLCRPEVAYLTLRRSG